MYNNESELPRTITTIGWNVGGLRVNSSDDLVFACRAVSAVDVDVNETTFAPTHSLHPTLQRFGDVVSRFHRHPAR